MEILSRPYSSDKTLDLGLDEEVAIGERLTWKTSPKPPSPMLRKIPLPEGCKSTQDRSLHLASLASCFRSSVTCAAAPAVTPASERILEFSGDVTDKSQAAVIIFWSHIVNIIN